MARGFQRKGKTYAAKLDDAERGVVLGLMEQVLDLVAPDLQPTTSGDPFDDIVAGLGSLGAGVSVAGEDQVPDGADALAERDPALARLLPTANREDEQAAAEFRRLTEHSLRTTKARNLRIAIESLAGAERSRVVLTEQQAIATVVALTDVRLVLGERLGLHTDEDVERMETLAAELDPDEPVVYAMAVYDFLTWLQETLATAMLPDPAGRED
ncbi:DUF2017 domain-containing protein [Actinomycetota bacterium]